MLEHVARARRAGDAGNFEEAYSSLYSASSIINSVFGDDFLVLHPDEPFDDVLREYIRVDAQVCAHATSAAGVARIEARLAMHAGGDNSCGELRWWVHDGALPDELPRETAVWLACRGVTSDKVRERFTLGKWVHGRNVCGTLLVHGPEWLHSWLSHKAPKSTGAAYMGCDGGDLYVPDIWRDDRENYYHHLPHVIRAARALSSAGPLRKATR